MRVHLRVWAALFSPRRTGLYPMVTGVTTGHHHQAPDAEYNVLGGLLHNICIPEGLSEDQHSSLEVRVLRSDEIYMRFYNRTRLRQLPDRGP